MGALAMVDSAKAGLPTVAAPRKVAARKRLLEWRSRFLKRCMLVPVE